METCFACREGQGVVGADRGRPSEMFSAGFLTGKWLTVAFADSEAATAEELDAIGVPDLARRSDTTRVGVRRAISLALIVVHPQVLDQRSRLSVGQR